MCDTSASCMDTEGSYTCTCNSGYTGNGETCNGIERLVSGLLFYNIIYIVYHDMLLEHSPSLYVDVNECEDDPGICNINANCTNTVGSYMCSCLSGYTGDGTLCTGEYKCCFCSYNVANVYIILMDAK